MRASSRLSLFFFFSSLLLVSFSTPPALATTPPHPPSSPPSADDASFDSNTFDDIDDARIFANNYTYQPPALQQQNVFQASTPHSESPKTESSKMCNKANSNPNRVVLPANVTPSHYTLTITPDLKEFTFCGYVEIE